MPGLGILDMKKIVSISVETTIDFGMNQIYFIKSHRILKESLRVLTFVPLLWKGFLKIFKMLCIMILIFKVFLCVFVYVCMIVSLSTLSPLYDI